MEKIKQFIKNYYVLLTVFFLLTTVVILPFFFSNNLEGFDTAGHMSSIYFIKNNFWPWPDGWNQYFLSGYPQGFFYPSLFHWLVAALSFVFSTEVSFKILISLSILFFIYIFYLLSLKISGSRKIASFALMIVSFFYLLENGLSDNLFTDIFYGMVSHLFSLTFFVAYVYSLFITLEKKQQFFVSGLLLALSVLSHAITGMAAIFLAIIVLLFSFKDKIFFTFLKQLILAVLLTACWWLPFLVNLNYVSGSSLAGPLMPLMIVGIPFIVLVSVINLVNFKKDKNIIIVSLASLNILIIGFYFSKYFYSTDESPLHFYRFLIYPFILTPLNLIFLLKRSKFNWAKINIISLSFLIYFFILLRIIPVGPFPVKLLDGIDKFYNSGRIIATGYSKNMDARFHSTRMKIVEYYKVPVFEGLFVESSANGRFIMSLLKSWGDNNENFTWGYKNLNNVINLSWGAKIFGINYEYNINDNSPKNEKNNLIIFDQVKKSENKTDAQSVSFDSSKRLFKINREVLADDSRVVNLLGGSGTAFYYQTFYKVADNYLAEALSVAPYSIYKNWSDATLKWWGTDWLEIKNEETYNKPILIWNKSVGAWNLADQETGLDLNLHLENKRMNSFSVDASSFNSPVPIYIKVSYFPFWHAYNEKGEELTIYKASPNFMLVYGNGEITFKYLKPWYYYFAYLVSGLTLLLGLIFSFFKKKKKWLQ